MANSDELRWRRRLEGFGRALKQLDAACAKDKYSDLERAGLVQMFEFTMELACKTLKDLLFYEGFETKTPRETLRRAFEAGYLTEDETEALLDALAKRSPLSHIYDERTAEEAERLIKDRFAPAFRALYDRLLEKRHT
jgi:nucleotidyltransferase substrate binding protein (TIGR01987 family)